VTGLIQGDVLLYNSKGVYGRIIAFKTWHKVTHVELYLGLGLSSASRNGVGVNLYPLREADLVYVWRPKMPFNAGKAMNYTAKHKGTPYGWLDLLAFAGLKCDGDGIVCSPWVTDVLRNNGIDPFNGEPSRLVAPFEFLCSPVGDVYEVVDGQIVKPRRRVVAKAPRSRRSAT
jgi:hypothetical protein